MNRFTRMTAVGLFGLLMFGCSMFRGDKTHELQMTGNPEFPAATGEAVVSTTDDGNTQINLEVKHLAPPEKINSGATAFVVWVRNNDENFGEPQNLGALKVDDDLSGSISAVTNLRSFDLYVTAEPTSSATSPTGDALLRTNVVMESLNTN